MRLALLAATAGAAVLLASFATTPAAATIRTVEANGSGQYATIQLAVAASVTGDIVELGDGTYRGNGNRDVDYGGKRITIRSRSQDPARCIIDCQGDQANQHFGFKFGSGCNRQSVLEYVTVAHGCHTMGGGIYIESGDCTVRGCVLRENTSLGEGGGLHVWGGSALVERCQFLANVCELGAGAAVSLGGASPAVFDHCVFSGNHGATEGGGVRF
jgi:hypothetical protein